MSEPSAGRNIGVMGGSFNPVHTGHLMLASYIAQHSDLDEVWLVVSPQNPLKSDRTDIIADVDRLAMLRIAVEPSPVLRACDIELGMPVPSYTVDTLAELSRRYPDCRFRLIIGGDNWAVFDRWKDHETILERHGVTVYPRPGYATDTAVADSRVTVVDAPQMEISSTFIRNEIAAGRDVNFFIPEGVYKYIKENNLYQKS